MKKLILFLIIIGLFSCSVQKPRLYFSADKEPRFKNVKSLKQNIVHINEHIESFSYIFKEKTVFSNFTTIFIHVELYMDKDLKVVKIKSCFSTENELLIEEYFLSEGQLYAYEINQHKNGMLYNTEKCYILNSNPTFSINGKLYKASNKKKEETIKRAEDNVNAYKFFILNP